MNLYDFQKWALSKKSVANPAPNYKYKGQCVSLIQQLLYNVYNLPFKAYGNAKDWATNNELLVNFDRLSSNTMLRPGDILVYPETYGNKYGHMGFIGSDGKYFDQNGIKKLEVAYKEKPYPNYTCILRYKMPKSNFNVRVDKPVAMVRKYPDSNSQTSGSIKLVRGDIFLAVAEVVGEEVYGNNIWYKSAKGNYVWSGGLVRL